MSAPQTPAGRWAAIEMLLNPVHIEVCPHCGQNYEVRDKPLIDREAAMALLCAPGGDLEGLDLEQLGECGGEGVAAWLPERPTR